MPRPLRVLNLASTLSRYAEGLRLQEAVLQDRKQELVGDTLILLQHYPVFTLGKRGRTSDFKVPQEALQAAGAEVVVVPRGGEVTFHGPGQLVAYPVIDVRQAGLGARAYVEGLEDAVVEALGAYGLAARGRVPGATGVWVGQRKIAAVGVRISQGLSSHGLALNVDPDLSFFDLIVPCGIRDPDRGVTSLRRELAGAAVGGGGAMGAGGGGGRSGGGGGGGADGGPAFSEVVEGFVRAFRRRLDFAPG